MGDGPALSGYFNRSVGLPRAPEGRAVASFMGTKDIKMRIGLTCTLGAIAVAHSLHAQTSTSDCSGAIQLCDSFYTEESAPLGTGDVFEFTGTCNQSLETASLWYTFTVQEAGSLSFILDPANDLDDYDWGLFNITNGGCAGIQDGTSPEVNCNSYGSLLSNGPTGMSSANGGTGVTNGPGDLNGPAFNADLPVLPGQTFALVVMNWTGSPDGYTINFSQSTANIYDVIPAHVVGVVPDCANQQFYIAFSENVTTSSVQPGDFFFTSALGEVYPCVTVTPDQPGAVAQNTFTLGLGQGIDEGGTFTLNITGVFGNVADPCGNLVADTTFQVQLIAPPSFDATATTACNGSNGAIQANATSGTTPAEFLVDGAMTSAGYLAGLNAGAHTVTMIDASGCEASMQVTVPDHELQVGIAQQQGTLSCATPIVTIQGVTITPPQDVQYAWAMMNDNGPATWIGSDPTVNVVSPGIYALQVTDPVTGCTDSASVGIIQSTIVDIDLSTLEFPNVISPNADGKNDAWRPFLPSDPDMDLLPLLDVYQVTIFDRWGKPVQDTGAANARAWNANDAADGTYFYRVSYSAGCGARVEGTRNGVVTVLR